MLADEGPRVQHGGPAAPPRDEGPGAALSNFDASITGALKGLDNTKKHCSICLSGLHEGPLRACAVNICIVDFMGNSPYGKGLLTRG